MSFVYIAHRHLGNMMLQSSHMYISLSHAELLYVCLCADTQAAVAANRAKFIYSWNFVGLPTANAIILDNICHFVGKGCFPTSALMTSL